MACWKIIVFCNWKESAVPVSTSEAWMTYCLIMPLTSSSSGGSHVRVMDVAVVFKDNRLSGAASGAVRK